MGSQRVTRHSGRSGKGGAYSSKHNDRQFDAENAEHINKERMKQNVYWDYLNGERVQVIAERNFLSEKSIWRIIRKMKISEPA